MATTSGRSSGPSPADVTKNLKGIDFPAEKKDLLKHAQHMKAEKIVLDEIQKMEERQYGSMAEVMKSYGKEHGGESGFKSSSERKAGQTVQEKSHSKPSHH